MKSYKDLPREVVLNAPDGAMWLSYGGAFYKFECGVMFVFHSEWVRTADHKLSNWTHCDEPLIPLPNVKIPWEADSVCPVPKGTRTLVELAYGGADECNEPELRYWNKLGNWVTAYTIIDEDYIRKEPADHENGVSRTIISTDGAGKIRDENIRDLTLIQDLEFLNYIAGTLPLIEDCAKAAMERLVEKWVKSCQQRHNALSDLNSFCNSRLNIN